MSRRHSIVVVVISVILSGIASFGITTWTLFHHVYVGDGSPPSETDASLWVDGESIFRRYGTPPAGHPGTPVGFRREEMPPASMGAYCAGSITTLDTPQRNFGGYIGMNGTTFPGQEEGQVFIGWRYTTTVTSQTIDPMLFAWRMRTLNGHRQPQVLFSAGSEGFQFYADDGNFWDPVPIAKIDTNGIVWAKGYAVLP